MSKTAAQLWTSHRDTAVVKKCKQYAEYTLPGLFVDPMVQKASVRHDFQSAAALLVNSLASKLTRALFPPGVPFFKSTISAALRTAAGNSGLSIQELENTLKQSDQQATERLFLNATTAALTQALKLLIVTGNVLLYRDRDAADISIWSLHSFTVRRKSNGKWRTVILKQRFAVDELPEDIRKDYIAKRPGASDNMSQQVDLYTRIEKHPGDVNPRVEVTNEIEGYTVGGKSSYPEHLCPWVVATWNLPSGRHYGSGLVEDYTGDFAKLSLMSEQLGLYELESLSILNLVDEAAGSVVDDYEKADTGDFVRGKVNGVTSYERGDYQKINAVNASLMSLLQRLSQAFMYTANTRHAERVTAEEIRNTAQEAEEMLGGVYSLLAEQVQVPLAYLALYEVSDELLAGLVGKHYRPEILTGIPALTRAILVQNMLAFSQEAVVIVPAMTQLDPRIDKLKLLDVLYNAKNIDTRLIFKDPDVLAQEAAAQRNAAIQQQDTAQLLSEAGNIQSTVNELG